MALYLPNVSLELTFLNGLQKPLQLLSLSTRLKLHSTIGQVFDPASDIIPTGELAHTVPKSDALYPPLIKYLYPFHETFINPACQTLPAKKVFPLRRIRYTSFFQPYINALVSHASLY